MLALVVVFAIVYLGLNLSAALLAVLLMLSGYLIHHLRQLAQLDQWLERSDDEAPMGMGEWRDAFYRIHKQLRMRQDRQELAVQNLEQMLQATRSLPDGVVILDKLDRIIWLNDAAERYLGLSRQRDVGQFIYYLLRNTRFSEWLALDDMSRSLKIRAPNTPDSTLHLQMVPIQLDQRMLMCHDITELERVDTMRRDFVANVSHELRTPITVITGFLEGFADMDAPSPEQFKKHIHLLCEQTDRIRHLLEDLLVLARLEGEQDIKNETVDVPALVESLGNDARSLSQGRHEVQVIIECRVKLIGRTRDLHSAFGNLVSNAVRYTPAGGRITLRWSLNDHNSAEFSVRDTGEGIAAQHIPRLTERFYRVDRGRSRATGGTGLGLAIVKHVLQRHEGRLKVESVLGKGSTFTAVLPADRVIPEAAPVDRPANRQR